MIHLEEHLGSIDWGGKQLFVFSKSLCPCSIEMFGENRHFPSTFPITRSQYHQKQNGDQLLLSFHYFVLSLHDSFISKRTKSIKMQWKIIWLVLTSPDQLRPFAGHLGSEKWSSLQLHGIFKIRPGGPWEIGGSWRSSSCFSSTWWDFGWKISKKDNANGEQFEIMAYSPWKWNKGVRGVGR